MRRVLIALLLLLLLLAGAAGALLWRVSRAPLSLAFLQPTLQAMIDRGAPFHVRFVDPSLVWDREENTLALQVRDVSARTDEGRLVVSAPLLRGTVSATSLILQQRVELVSVNVELPEIGLEWKADKRLALRFSGELAEVPVAQTAGGGGLQALLGGAEGGGDPRLAKLRLVEISAPLLKFTDASTGATATAQDPLFRLTRAGDGWQSALTGRVADARVAASAALAPGTSRLDARFDIEALRPRDVAAALPELPLGGIDLPISGRVNAQIDTATGVWGAGELDLTAAAGQIAVPSLKIGPLQIRGASLQAAMAPGWQAAEITRAQLLTQDFELGLTGQLGEVDGQFTSNLKLTAQDLDVAEVVALWPGDVAAAARLWVAENVLAGKIADASIQVGDHRPQPGQVALGGGFSFSAAQVRYLDAFPPATDLAGRASLAGDSLSLNILGGRTGEVTLAKGDVTLANLLGEGVTRLAVAAELSSTLPAALGLLDRKPIELSRKTGLATARIEGSQATRLTLSLPLIDPLPDSQIRYRADAALRDFKMPEVMPGYGVTASSFAVVAESAGVTASGALRVNDVPVTIDFRDNAAPVKGVTRRVRVSGEFDAEAARRLKLAWPAPVGGVVGVEATVTEQRAPMRKAEVQLDLGRATLDLPALKIAKRPGEAGRASLALSQADERSLTVESLDLDLARWRLKGQGELGLDPIAPRRLALQELRGPLGDLTADLNLQNGTWRGRVDIGALDVRPLLAGDPGAKSGKGGGSGGGLTLPDLSLRLAAGQLRVGETPFSRVSGLVERSGGQWTRAAIAADIMDSKASLDLTTSQGRSQVALRSTDAGWFIRSVGSSDNGIRGGTLRLDAELQQRASDLKASGKLKIRDFTLWGAPTIARIVSLASFSGLVNALSGKGVPVRRLVAPFTLEREVITLTAASLVGSDIGARADGTIDLGRDRLNISGTVAPAYTVNRFLGRIPIIGQLMSGGQSDALLAATFSVRGPIGGPEVTVNPLAALVPGVIRDLFGAMEDEG